MDDASNGTKVTPERYAPYLAWKTFFNLILQLQEKGTPQRIDRSFLTGRSGADQTYLINTLKAFDLIGEDGTVQLPLTRLVHEKDDRQGQIGQILRKNYPEVFKLAENATQAQLDETFAQVFPDIQGDTRRKAETFFLQAATYAGIKLSPHFKATRSASKSRKPKRDAHSPPADRVMAEPPDRVHSPPPEASMVRAYFEVLLEKVKAADDPSKELLDRIEKLLPEMEKESN